MSQYKTVLIISYYFPPAGGPASQRVAKFTRYLYDFGYHPVVLTVDTDEYPSYDELLSSEIPDQTPVYRMRIFEPYSGYKKFIGMEKSQKVGVAFINTPDSGQKSMKSKLARWIRAHFFIPDARVFWRKPARKIVSGIVKKHQPVCVFSSGPPHTVHLIAMDANNHHQLPWIADFRDPWTTVDYYRQLNITGRAHQKHLKLEQQVLESADFLTVASPGILHEFQKKTQTPVRLLTNGVDFSQLPTPERLQREELVFTYVGSVYRAENWIDIFEAFQKRIQLDPLFGKKLIIQFIGNLDQFVYEKLVEYELKDNCEFFDFMPHEKAIKAIFNSDINILVINKLPGNELVLTSKLFEYLAAKKPILYSGPIPGDAWTFINKYGHPLLPADIATISKTGIDQSSLGETLMDFDRKHLTKILAEYFDTLIGRNKGHGEN